MENLTPLVDMPIFRMATSGFILLSGVATGLLGRDLNMMTSIAYRCGFSGNSADTIGVIARWAPAILSVPATLYIWFM